jgi:manganese/zinc/iron transport system substrate-binding protein
MLCVGVFWLALGIGARSASAQQSVASDGSARPKVLATTSLIGDLVREIAGSELDVDVLMGPGVDPHLYKVTPGDIRRLSSADLILYHGLHLEGRMGEAFESLARKKPVVAVADQLPAERIRRSSDVPDPHVWFDVSLWKFVAQRVADELTKRYPILSARITERHGEFQKQLSELDAMVAKEISSIPKEQRVLVTAHDAFAYFGARYGITVYGVQGISTDSEAGLRHIQDLIDLLVRSKIPAVFMESSVGERSIQALVDGAQNAGHTVSIAGPLYSDALGEPGTGAETYLGMVRANVGTIVAALGATRSKQ